jgi:hypothetical protein
MRKAAHPAAALAQQIERVEAELARGAEEKGMLGRVETARR